MNFRQYLELNILRWIHFGNCYGNGMVLGGLRYLCGLLHTTALRPLLVLQTIPTATIVT
ncbi:hypothetical protein NC653_013449 [Populus alba x Populus x berolinensis]|uniref:Uncharacterized protein n=1 Tax=Populus alba x Populus x berolinensis TaxID=444605 RepID=A0AAD6QUH2_9ROSI|nr:hypothetical protein NC653_013449 [Populus alba x Populus x berolinensis]